MALAMIEGAEERGDLRPGDTVVEYTGGSTGSSLAMVCAIKGYRGIGTEVVAQIDGRIDAVCIYVGVGGAMIGTSEGIATRWPDVHRIAVEPAESAVLSGGSPGTHRIEGGGVGFVPPHLQPDEHGAVPYDEVIGVSTADAFAMARRAAVEEGIWGGPSGGANLVAAIRVAERLGEGHQVITVQCDSGMKYLNGDLYA